MNKAQAALGLKRRWGSSGAGAQAALGLGLRRLNLVAHACAAFFFVQIIDF
jgi:hypothetical protein